jgi:hypothetical protein
MPPNTAGDLLALWDRAAMLPPGRRDDALLGSVFETPPISLGARNAALLALRARLFGGLQTLRARCPQCHAAVEFTIDCEQLSRRLQPASEASVAQTLQLAGLHIVFRAPDVDDVRAAACAAADSPSFVRALLERCVLSCERDDHTPVAVAALPATAGEAISRRLEEIEPGASVSFALACPECGACWDAPMNCGAVLWSELGAHAERLLLDVDVLARAYGWSEAEVLALSPTRRSAYLQLVGAS